jgi:DNA-binding MarR family transcriptional regulator
MDQHWSESLYVSMAKAYRNISRVAEEAFTTSDLSPSHGALMLLLDEWKELSPMEIASSIDVSPSTATRLLDKLARLALIERRYEGIHSYVTLSTKGQQKIPEIQGCFDDMERRLKNVVTSRLRDRAISVSLDMTDRFARGRRP